MMAFKIALFRASFEKNHKFKTEKFHFSYDCQFELRHVKSTSTN